MTVELTTDQETRIQAMIRSGAYDSVQDVVDAAVAAVEQIAEAEFEGTDTELQSLLLAGLNSPEVPEDEFWRSTDRETDAMLAEPKGRLHP